MQSGYMIKSPRVRLDDYICDLNLEIAPGGYVCYPLSSDGFSNMWGGCKATYGIRSGKVCFEVKILEYNDVTCQDVDTHVVRVGWSTDNATLQLGEDKNSFGFGGTGKKSVNRKFANYGRRFEKGDVVGCYLAMENGWLDISYTVNGRFCGSAFKIRWMTDEALFPHVLTKNCKLEVNFGQASHPYFSLQPGYKLIDHTPPEFRIPSVRSPISQSDCEVVMMVGLPGAGKSTWAANYAKIHPSKKYFILGTDSIIDKMRVQGLPRKNNFSGRWDVLIKQASDCFNVLLKKASNLPRNLILDQTNVYASARRRKVKQYREKGYTINAMVLVPRDEDLVRRSEQRTREEGKEVPQSAVLDMKANFSLPCETEGLFDNIIFLELQRPEAQAIVERYNREAMDKGHQSNRQKGFASNMNQMERKNSNRYFDHHSSNKPPGFRSNDQFNQPPQQDYSAHNRGAIKRPDSSNHGPPDKYRRSDPSSTSSRNNFPPQNHPDYERDAIQSRLPEERWLPPGQNVIKQAPVKDELRQEARDYGENYGRQQPNNANFQAGDWQNEQYNMSMKPDPYPGEEKVFPRQEAFDRQQHDNSSGYHPHTYQQPPQAQPRFEGSYNQVKTEASDGWFGQGSSNHDAGDGPQHYPANSHYNQQSSYLNSHQHYGTSMQGGTLQQQTASGYTPDIKMENHNNHQVSQQYGNGGSYNKPNNQGSEIGSYYDRSNNQQWQESNYSHGHPQTPAHQYNASSEKPLSNSDSRRAPRNEENMHGNYQEPYSDQQSYGREASQYFVANKEPGVFSKQEYNTPQAYGQDSSYNPSQSRYSNSGFPSEKREDEFSANNQNWNDQTIGQNWQDPGPDPSWQLNRVDPGISVNEGQRLSREPQGTVMHSGSNRLQNLIAPAMQSERPYSQEDFSKKNLVTRIGDVRKPGPPQDHFPDRMTPSMGLTKQENQGNFPVAGERQERGKSPRGNRNRESEDARHGRRDGSPSRRGGRDESYRRGGDSNHRRGDSRHSPRDDSRRESSRRGREDSSSRRGENHRRGGGDRGSKDTDSGRERTRSRGSRRDERDRDRPRDKKSDGRFRDERGRSNDRSRSDRSRDDRRRDETSRDTSRVESGSSDKSKKANSDRSNPPTKESERRSLPSTQKATGLLPLPGSLPVPTDKSGPPQPTPPITGNTLSKLSNVDFDKLRAGLATMRKHSKNIEIQSSPVKPVKGQESGGDDMDLVSDEETNPAVQHPAPVMFEPRTSSSSPRMKFSPKASLLGLRPEVPRPSLRPRAHREPPRPHSQPEFQGLRSQVEVPRPRPQFVPPPPRFRPRLEARKERPPTSYSEEFVPRFLPSVARRPLLNTPRSRALLEEREGLHGVHYPERIPSRPPLQSRPRAPHPMGMRLLRPRAPGVRPRLRVPAPRGIGRPPLIRGPPRRPFLPRYTTAM